MGAVRVDLRAVVLGAVIAAINGRNGGGRARRRLADDQAAGGAVPHPVRGLVLGDRWLAGGAEGGRDRQSSASCGCRSSRNNGPANYLGNLATYQNEIFNVLSLRAWNVWWLLQEAAGAVSSSPMTWRSSAR